ncbi:MAG TPA: NADH:flavin oxidoreductase, partial [Bacillota bacterium]
MAGLFTPLTVKGLTFQTRIVMPPMANNMAPPDGSVTDRHVDHYTARAGRDVAVIMVEHSYVRPDGRAGERQLGIYDDALIPGLSRLAEAVKRAGSLVGIQITHSGSRTTSGVAGRTPRGPSNVVVPGDKEVPEPFPAEELPDIVRAFGQAARRAVEAGFDLIEIHGAHGYLLNEFLSPYTNRREDGFGGSPANRLRLPLEVVREVRRRVGMDRVLMFRLGSDDMLEGGLHLAN